MERKKTDILEPMPEHDKPEPKKPRPENSPQSEIVNPGPATIVNPSSSPEIDRTNIM